MFRLLVSHLMLCSLGVHTLLGCCWHHAHADSESPANSQQQITQQSRPHIHLGCGHHHDHGHHHPQEAGETEAPLAPEHPANVPCCVELPCSYVASVPSKLPLPEMDQLDETPLLVAIGSAPLQLTYDHSGRGESVSAFRSAILEVRDATQVWLL